MSSEGKVVDLMVVRGGRDEEHGCSDEQPVVDIARRILKMAEAGEIDDLLCVAITSNGSIHTGMALRGCPVRALGAVDVLRNDVFEQVE